MAKKADLDRDEEQQVDEYKNVPSSVIYEAIRQEGEHGLSRPFSALWWSGVAAGLTISTSVLCKGVLASILPHVDSAGEVLMIVIPTYIIGLGGMSHVVAGSTELFILLVRGELGSAAVVLGGILPAFAGNVLGGTGIFAALTYAQLREEI